MTTTTPRCEEHAGEAWPSRCDECDRLAFPAVAPTREAPARARAREAGDVRAAIARGLLPGDWPWSRPLPDDVRARLAELRERDRAEAGMELETGEESVVSTRRGLLIAREPRDPAEEQVTPAIQRFAHLASGAMERRDFAAFDAALDQLLAEHGTNRVALGFSSIATTVRDHDGREQARKATP